LFILRAIFAFDRIMRRVPSIIEIWFFEFIFLMALGLGLGRLLDGLGVDPCPPAVGSIDGTAFGFIAVGLAMGWLVLRRALRPKVLDVTWTPVFVARNVGGLSHVPVPNHLATVNYQVLSSHPSYGFVNLWTLPIPVVMMLGYADYGCSLSHFRLAAIVMFMLMGALIVLRPISWYVLRRGRDALRANNPDGLPESLLEWELGWKPLVSMMSLMAAAFIVVFIWAWFTM
jgi:hypothetical protein